MALIFYHRGAKLKPGREEFRLGIQKATQAIDNAVGGINLHVGFNYILKLLGFPPGKQNEVSDALLHFQGRLRNNLAISSFQR